MMGFALTASGAMLETKRCILRANRKQAANPVQKLESVNGSFEANSTRP